MKLFQLKKHLILIAISITLSLVIIHWHTQTDVPFCVNSAGCSATQPLRGKVTTRVYGYPTSYRQIEVFNPTDTNQKSSGYVGYTEAKVENQKFNIVSVITNFIFWFALLYLLARFIKPKRRMVTNKTANEPLGQTTDLETH